METPLWDRTTISAIRQLDDPAGHSHIVSMLDPEWPEPDQFDAWPADCRIVIRFHDEIAPREQRLLPDRAMVEELLQFGQTMVGAKSDPSRLFIHCQSGMSRSTAGALILWAQAHPDTPAERYFAMLARVRPIAWPNTLMLAIADELLERRESLARAAIPFLRGRLAEDPELEARMIKLRRAPDIEAIATLG